MNTLSRVVGLDGLNRLLMGSGAQRLALGENVYEVPDNSRDGAYGVLSGTTASLRSRRSTSTAWTAS